MNLTLQEQIANLEALASEASREAVQCWMDGNMADSNAFADMALAFEVEARELAVSARQEA